MGTQELGFKAEVQQLLNLMIHSVYSDRDVFLRELVSNAADALDKAHFMSLTRSDLVAAGSEDAGIRVSVDADKGIVTIEDDGVGLTEEEAIENLGTIAHSGTKAFLEQLGQEADAPQLIGQFGLGFYSAFMVAEEVEVESRSVEPDATPIRWTSKGQGTFTLGRGERQTRGTTITLILRDDSKDFADAMKLRGIVRKHSNFLTWPISVDEEQANSGKALWAEPASQVSDEEANSFYQSIAMDWQEPALRIHLSVDSPLQYHALLFIPQQRPYDLFYPEAPKGPRLYARRVLIDEHAKDLLPDWLRFVRGVVDSEDIQLNVSREMVQKTPVVQKIRKQLTKRILKDLAGFAKRSAAEDHEGPGFEDVWRNFGVLLKEAFYHEKDAFGKQLIPLFRFNAVSHDDGDGLISLADYKAAMADEQDTIWYLCAESREAALASPHLEAFQKKGWDVLLLTEPVDEWMVSALTDFDEVPLKSVSRGELELDEEEDDAERADLTGFNPWVAEVLDGVVAEVRASSRLTDSACVLVDAEDGVSGNMERILRQANQEVAASGRALELNPRHPLIKNLAALHSEGKTDAAKPLVRLLYDDALLLEGTVKDAPGIGRRLQDVLEMAARAAMG